MPESPRVLPAVFDALNREVLNDLALASSIDHPGESGRAREQIIRRFLRRLLPDGYRISTGFVIDATGGISRQVDLVIHRTGYHPVLEIGGIEHFLVESVAAVIENKAAIDSAADLEVALANIESVKGLDRTNHGTNHALPLTGGLPPVNPDDFQHQVFGAVVTEASLSSETFVRLMLEWLGRHPRVAWPNMYVDVHKFVMGYARPAATPPSFGAIPESHMGMVSATEGQAPLLSLAFELCNYLRVAPLVDYSALDYFALRIEAPGLNFWTIPTDP